jgi:uncharacterized protein YuzE
MAILEKRKSVNQLPRFKRYQDTRGGDRAAALRGETPITSEIRQTAGSSGYEPMGETEGFRPMGRETPVKGITSTTKGATTKGSTGPATAKTTVGGKTAADVTSKLPGLTSKTTDASKTGKSLTSTGTGAAKTTTAGGTTTTGGKTVTSPGSGTTGTKTTASQVSNLGKTLTSALTGAAIGAGTKAVIDRLTGGKKTTVGTGTVGGAKAGVGDKTVGGTGTTGGTTGGTKTVGGTGTAGGTGTVGGTKTTGAGGVGTDVNKKVSDLTKGTVTGATTGAVTKPVITSKTISDKNTAVPKTGGTQPKGPGGLPTKTGTTGATAPKTGATGATAPKTGATGATAPKTGAATKGATAPKTGTTRGLTSKTVSGGSTTGATQPNVSAATNPAYDEDGNLMPGYELDEDGNPVWMGDKETSTTFNPDGTIGESGNTTETLDDGTTITYDRDGNVVGYTDIDGVKYDAEGNETETTSGTGGNTTETLDDGTTITYDSNGNVLGYTDIDGFEYDADGNEIDGFGETVIGDETEETVFGGAEGDDLGGTDQVDMSGELVDDEGNVYDADGNFLRYADGTTYTETEDPNAVAYTDEYGGTYNSAGDLISEGDYSSFTQQDAEGNTYDYYGNLVSEADHSDFRQNDEFGNVYDYYGNLVEYAPGFGEDNYSFDGTGGYDNTDYEDTNYGGYDNTDYDDTSYYYGGDEDVEIGKKGGLFQYAKGGGVDHPVHEKYNSDGTITQMFDDGSFITYNGDGDVIRVAEAGKVQKFDVGGQAYAPVNTAEEYQDAGYLRGADQGRLQAFLNNLPQEGDDGPQSEGDLGGYPISTTYYGGGGGDEDLGSEGGGDGLPLSTTYYGGSQPSRPLGQTFPAGYVDNGDGTATYVDDDGSTITIDADNNIVFVTDATGETIVDNSEELATTGNQQTQGDNSPATTEETDEDPIGALATVAQNRERDQSYMPPGAVDQGDGTFKIGNQVYSMDTGKPLYTTDDEGNITRVEPSTQNGYVDNGDGTYTIGNKTYDIETDDPLYEERGGTTYDMNGKPLWTTDSAGNIIPPTITSAGSSGGTSLGGNKTGAEKVGETQLGRKTSSAIDDLIAGLNTYGGAGAAGAVLGALLGNTDLFSPSNAGGGNTVDMSQVGVINPRTTDFGIGPTKFVGYDQYGTPERMPELYGRELYQNLNAPGFNEVNPGDYARMDAEMEAEMQPEYDGGEGDEYTTGDDEYTTMPVENPDYSGVYGMAEGGTPQGGLGMQTYYTFGTPVDPMQNLYNPQPMQQQAPQQPMQNQMAPQPQGMPQGMPQGQQMPQQNPMQTGPQGLKSGGLPAWSNVPVTAGRLNFRHGAPVHGPGDGQSDDIPAMLADGEYVIDAETVAQIGNGSTKAGAAALDKFRENIRAHKRSAPINKIPPKTKALTSYLKGAR